MNTYNDAKNQRHMLWMCFYNLEKKNIVFLLQVSIQQSLQNAYRQSSRHSGGTKLANAVVLRDTYEDVNKLFDFHKEKTFTSNTTWKSSVEKILDVLDLNVCLLSRDQSKIINVRKTFSWRKGTTKQWRCNFKNGKFSVVDGISI